MWNWELLASEAGGNMSSGGGAILAGKGTGVERMCQNPIPDTQACLHLGRLYPERGHLLLNVYLKDSEGMSATNKLLLETAAGALKDLKGPWIAQGEWNMPPD